MRFKDRSRRTSATFGDAADEWLRYVEHERGVKASTLCDYRNVIEHWLRPQWGAVPLADITARRIEAWKATATHSKEGKRRALSPRKRQKLLTIMHGVMERARRVHGLPSNPVADVELPRASRGGDLEVFSPEEVWARSRAAGSDQDGVYLVAAFTGMRRGELLALRWRDA